jgi:glutamyl-tRNA synthetase
MVRTRIAPSPTGYPHIGTAFQALFDYVYAKQNQGQFIIRIEDTDRERLVEGAEDAIFNALEWLGIKPDEGPRYGGDVGPYRQSERLDIYQKYAKELVEKGHAYYCFCSSERLEQVRNERQTAGLPPMYDRHCRNLDPKEAAKRAETEPYVIRMKIPDNESVEVEDMVRGKIVFQSNVIDDQILMKSDGFPTYHLAVVVDDHIMNITHMIRGEEWISSSPKHVLLYKFFGWQCPKMIHTPLLRNPDKSKLSKRHGHSAITWYKDQGYLPETVINFLATRVWNHPDGQEIFAIDELIKRFAFEHMHILGPIVDLKKLDWMNGIWIRQMDNAELIKRLKPFQPSGLSNELLATILPLIKERLVKLSDLAELTTFFYEDPTIDVNELLKQTKLDKTQTAAYLKTVIETLEGINTWSIESLETTLRNLQAKSGLKPRPAFMSIRLSLTGSEATPPLFDVMHVLGKDTCIKRIDTAIASLQ